MRTRKPIVAGQFYPGQRDACIDEINECLDAITITESLPEVIVAGIVPHAGWAFSGSLAAAVFLAISQQHEKVHTFVIFGAAHGYFGASPAVCDKGRWETPAGEVLVDEELAEAVLKTARAVCNFDSHLCEHSIEVQVPFIQYLFAGAKILPILVPPTDQAVPLGEAVAEIISRNEDKKVVCIGSTDLTHYGPRYGFVPMGAGKAGLDWARNVNDMKFIELALKLKSHDLLAGSIESGNACGPGAAVATIAAAKKLGSRRGVLLAHTTSNDVMLQKMGSASADSVGYAAIVF